MLESSTAPPPQPEVLLSRRLPFGLKEYPSAALAARLRRGGNGGCPAGAPLLPLPAEAEDKEDSIVESMVDLVAMDLSDGEDDGGGGGGNIVSFFPSALLKMCLPGTVGGRCIVQEHPLRRRLGTVGIVSLLVELVGVPIIRSSSSSNPPLSGAEYTVVSSDMSSSLSSASSSSILLLLLLLLLQLKRRRASVLLVVPLSNLEDPILLLSNDRRRR